MNISWQGYLSSWETSHKLTGLGRYSVSEKKKKKPQRYVNELSRWMPPGSTMISQEYNEGHKMRWLLVPQSQSHLLSGNTIFFFCPLLAIADNRAYWAKQIWDVSYPVTDVLKLVSSLIYLNPKSNLFVTGHVFCDTRYIEIFMTPCCCAVLCRLAHGLTCPISLVFLTLVKYDNGYVLQSQKKKSK